MRAGTRTGLLSVLELIDREQPSNFSVLQRPEGSAGVEGFLRVAPAGPLAIPKIRGISHCRHVAGADKVLVSPEDLNLFCVLHSTQHD
jgi:hypothetical protein